MYPKWTSSVIVILRFIKLIYSLIKLMRHLYILIECFFCFIFFCCFFALCIFGRFVYILTLMHTGKKNTKFLLRQPLTFWSLHRTQNELTNKLNWKKIVNICKKKTIYFSILSMMKFVFIYFFFSFFLWPDLCCLTQQQWISITNYFRCLLSKIV